jgi:hypothetical protein
MSTIKDYMTEIIKSQPDDSTFNEILSELAFSKMVDRGLGRCSRGKSGFK